MLIAVPLQVVARNRLLLVMFSVVVLLLVLNLAYQVMRKPAELFFPVSGVLKKTPPETWREYEPLFRRFSTATITPELLAALAQVEGSGDPLARTQWRLRLTQDPFQIYRPASSAVGMYQMTDGMFAEARRYCIHDHEVADDGPWHDWGSCWFNAVYVRVLPGHSIEMTSAFLDRRVNGALERHRVAAASAQQKQDLAALIHLCGAGTADGYVRRGFRLAPGQRCGEHNVRAYLAQVNAMKRVFARLSTFR